MESNQDNNQPSMDPSTTSTQPPDTAMIDADAEQGQGQEEPEKDEQERRRRFTRELEFVMCLANPAYLGDLARKGLLQNETFIRLFGPLFSYYYFNFMVFILLLLLLLLLDSSLIYHTSTPNHMSHSFISHTLYTIYNSFNTRHFEMQLPKIQRLLLRF